jgi:mannan endo-1,4-beta-mannosidase
MNTLISILIVMWSYWLPIPLQLESLPASNQSWSEIEYRQLVDRTNGYRLDYPGHMQVDESLAPIRQVVYDHHTRIEIYYDDFRDTVSDSKIYMDYSNRFLSNTTDHVLEKDTYMELNGRQAHYVKWHRAKLPRVADDKNYYLSVEIAKNKREVYTLLFKSNQPIENEMDILSRFQLIEHTEDSPLQAQFQEKPLQVNPETRRVYEHFFSKDSKLRWGIFEPEAPDQLAKLSGLEKYFQYSFDIVVRYQSLDTGFPKEAIQNAHKHGKLVELTLQTMHYGQDNSSITYDILNGEYDDYLHQYAEDIRAFGHPILFRLNNEMNGDWVVYSSYHSSKDTDLYQEVWRYIHSIFRAHGVDNVLWVWNPNHRSLPEFAWNDELLYYPGDEYVDIVGMTAYNTGTYYSGETWSSFKQLYDPLYERYTSLFDKPLMITEFASSSIGGDKAAWIEDMFLHIRQYPRIKAAIWWSHVDLDGSTVSRIYRIDESKEVMDRFANGLRRHEAP